MSRFDVQGLRHPGPKLNDQDRAVVVRSWGEESAVGIYDLLYSQRFLGRCVLDGELHHVNVSDYLEGRRRYLLANVGYLSSAERSRIDPHSFYL